MAEENDTLKLASVNYTTDNYLAAKKNEDGSYNVAGKVVFNEDITTPAGEVATKSDLDGKQDQLTSDNAGDNITITGEGSTLKINAAAGGGGETKAKTWVCHFINIEADCDFNHLKEYPQTGIDSCRDYGGERAIIKFTEEKSMAEVNKWLLFEAKLTMYDDHIIANNQGLFGICTPFAVYPWPEDKPWPESN